MHTKAHKDFGMGRRFAGRPAWGAPAVALCALLAAADVSARAVGADEAHTVRTGAYGQYAFAQAADAGATLAVTALGQTREIVFATDCFRRLDFTAGEAAAAGTLAIGPEVVAVDLERTPDFAFVCRQTQADGSLSEVVPT